MDVAPQEMYRTFNMGIGMILIVSPEEAGTVREDLAARGEASYCIGQVVENETAVVLEGGEFDA